jgi:hypothetical protein
MSAESEIYQYQFYIISNSETEGVSLAAESGPEP